MDREKVIKGLENCNQTEDACEVCPYYNDFNGCMLELREDALALLKEDCHNCKLECLLDRYDQLKEKYDKLLKEQEAAVKQWTKEIADYQLAHAPKDSHEYMSLTEHLENEYKRGVWDGLQIAWNIISEGR